MAHLSLLLIFLLAFPQIITASIPTKQPSSIPFQAPTILPTFKKPSPKPSNSPSLNPSQLPTIGRPRSPTHLPSVTPTTKKPTLKPTIRPSSPPTKFPTGIPSAVPTRNPSYKPPTYSPTVLLRSSSPTGIPSVKSSWAPTSATNERPRPLIVPPLNNFYWDIHKENLSSYTVPALFSITNYATTGKQIGPFSFSIGATPSNDILSSGFESMSFRYRFQAQSDSDGLGDRVFADTSIFDQYINGLFDNGTARVYRMVNNQFTLIRQSRIARYHSSGWQPDFLSSDSLLSPSSTQAAFRFPGWYGSPATVWVKIVAVALKNGYANESKPSVAVFNWTNIDDGSNAIYYEANINPLPANMQPIQHAGNTDSFTVNTIPQPQGLTARQDPSTGQIQLTWSFPISSIGSIAGFRLYRSSWPSSAQEGYSISLQHDGGTFIRQGDLVFTDTFLNSWSRKKYASERIYGTPAASNPALAPQFYNDETNGMQSWAYVPHPAPVPSTLSVDGGKTCQMVTSKAASTVRIAEYFYGPTTQSYYFIFQGGATYTVDGWFRSVAGKSVNVSFYLNQFYNQPSWHPCVASLRPQFPFVFAAHDNWQRYTINFTIPLNCIYSSDGPIGQAIWEWSGPSTLYMDNLRIYEATASFGDWLPADYQAMKISGMNYLRSHQFATTGFAYSMDGFTNAVGGNNQYGNSNGNSWTLPSLLSVIRKANLNPWLQIEMCMSEVEWLGLVEYLCATYDPLHDTPAAKPWAYKRFSQGQVLPWIESFQKILLELSNETWNWLFFPWTFLGLEMVDSVTKKTIGDGTLYGIFQERVISILKSSPYWSAKVEAKFTFVIGGWAAQLGEDGYGQMAAKNSPSSKLVTVAGYNGGWERGQLTTDSKDGFLGILVEDVITLNGEGEQLTLSQLAMEQSGSASYSLGTYEAGPGYNLNGLNGVSITDAQVEAESLAMKSQAGGVATLDTFLYRAQLGWTEQNFFTFQRNRYYWVSHAPLLIGGWAYPPWSALTMFNLYATGKFLLVNPVNVPRMDFQGTNDIPLIAVYATVTNTSDYCVFVISRKLNNYPFVENDGHTSVSLALPFYAASSAEVVYLSSPSGPMTPTLDNNSVPLIKGSLNVSRLSFSPTFSVNIPPGSVHLYIFHKVRFWKKDPPTDNALISPIRKIVQYPTVNIQFQVAFFSPWNDFSVRDVVVSGSAGASRAGLTIAMDTWSRNTSAILTISDMRQAGNVTVSIGLAQSSAQYLVSATVPPVPLSPFAVVTSNVSFAVLHWKIQADISSYPIAASVQWGYLPSSLTHSSGVKRISDSCSRCFLCDVARSIFCSNASLIVSIGPALSPTTPYQNKKPLFFSVQSSNAAGLSAPISLSTFAFSDNFNSSSYPIGGLPTGWLCSPSSDCSYAKLEAYNSKKPVLSPSHTPYMHFVQWGTAIVAYNYNGTHFLTAGLQFLQYYTVRMTFSVAGTNGYSLIGALLHLADYNNYLEAVIFPTSGIFRLFGKVSGQPYYGCVVNIIPDNGESSASTAFDLGEFWSLEVATLPAGDQYCPSMLEVRVSIRDQTGACRVDFSGVTQVGSCVFSVFTDCVLGGSMGTFAMFSSVANGGDGSSDRIGHFISNFAVDSVPLN